MRFFTELWDIHISIYMIYDIYSIYIWIYGYTLVGCFLNFQTQSVPQVGEMIFGIHTKTVQDPMS